MSAHRPTCNTIGIMPIPIMSANLPVRPGEAIIMASGAAAAWIAGQRLHLQHGPIDLIIGADGAADKVGAAFAAAANCFAELLSQLVSELTHLRQPAGLDMPALKGPVAARMQAGVNQFLSGPAPVPFITPMAAVAGAVADHVLAAMTAAAGPGLPRAYVNNGGDIALTLGPEACFEIGVADDRDVHFSDFYAIWSRRAAGYAAGPWPDSSYKSEWCWRSRNKRLAWPQPVLRHCRLGDGAGDQCGNRRCGGDADCECGHG